LGTDYANYEGLDPALPVRDFYDFGNFGQDFSSLGQDFSNVGQDPGQYLSDPSQNEVAEFLARYPDYGNTSSMGNYDFSGFPEFADLTDLYGG
jgi:hypothetical protein